MSRVSEVSKNAIVPIRGTRIQKNYLNPEHTWVWLEDWAKYHHTKTAVAYAKRDVITHTPQVGRTKYKVYRNTNSPSTPTILTSDNSYVEQSWEQYFGRKVAYYWDKKAIKTLVDEAFESYNKNHPEDKLKVRSAIDEYTQIGVLIREFLKKGFPEKSLLVRLDDYPTFYECYDYLAYAPVEGYYISAPELKPTPNIGGGYEMVFFLNNKKTEKCPQFIESHRILRGGIFCMNGHLITKWEGTTQSFNLHNLINGHLGLDQYPATTQMLLCDCVWTITKDLAVPSVEKTFISRTRTTDDPYKTFHPTTFVGETVVRGGLKDTYPHHLTDLKRLEFAKELSEKVFHPDRVARFMGDTWGTEDSWLAQVM